MVGGITRKEIAIVCECVTKQAELLTISCKFNHINRFNHLIETDFRKTQTLSSAIQTTGFQTILT